jgi:ParB-like chromosome segregation protein Spo0J
MKIEIAKIKVGKRLRADLGDLTNLKKSIELLGLLHPIVVTEGLVLVAGERRLQACKELGQKKIDAVYFKPKLEVLKRGQQQTIFGLIKNYCRG